MKTFEELTGDSVDEIINQFIEEHGISKEQIQYEVVDQGSKGILGLGKKLAKVKISYDRKEVIKRKSKLILNELLEKSGFGDAHIITEEKGDRIILNIESETPEILIGKSAQTLDSLQYIMDKMLNLSEDSEIMVILDVGGYRQRKVEENVAKALALAEKVKRTGRSIKLNPMVAIIRKEIHIALKEVYGVSTVSIGEGRLKQISIVSKKARSSRPFSNHRGSGGDRGRYNRNRG